MQIEKYIHRSRIIDLQAQRFGDAILELLQLCPKKALAPGADLASIHQSILKRESSMTTCLGNGVAIPHIKLDLKVPHLLLIGRCKQGLEHPGGESYKTLQFVVLLLSSDSDKDYLHVLSSLARIFQDSQQLSKWFASADLKTLRREVLQTFHGTGCSLQVQNRGLNQMMLRQAEKIAKGARCATLLIFGDTFSGGLPIGENLKSFKIIWVTQMASEVYPHHARVDDVIVVRSFSTSRLSQLRSAALIGITRGIIRHNERLCCLGGVMHSNILDTIVVVDVAREFQVLFNKKKHLLPEDIQPEVLERVVAIATELGIEGREGRSVGSLFVIGNVEALAPYIKPLVLNPFYGYKEEDRNILNPFMDETVKEFSSIDGAFIIRGDGVLESAGSLIHAPAYSHQLPGGLGTRHAAAAAISLATPCIAITVSASNGQVTLFRSGQMLPLFDKNPL